MISCKGAHYYPENIILNAVHFLYLLYTNKSHFQKYHSLDKQGCYPFVSGWLQLTLLGEIMKFSYMILFVLLAGLSGCATNGNKPTQEVQLTGTGILIIKPIAFEKDAYIRDAVKQECNLDEKLSQFIKENAAGQYANIVTDSSTGPADAQIMTVEIEEVQGAAGGAWSGAKSVVIKGSLSQQGKMLGDFKARRYSGGGVFGGYKGTCAILGRCVKTLGRDVAEWMAHPTSQAILGDM